MASLLVGDTRQHESVEAGRIFAQMQESGMRTVKLDTIVRQKDAELKQTVEQLTRGEVGEAIASLERQGRVHEVKGHAERIAAIAKEYAKSPQSTLVVSPDNRSRVEINQAIHAELQARGLVASVEHRTQVLVPRQDLTGADRMWAARYNAGDVLLYSRSSTETGIAKGEYARVTSVDAAGNRLTVVRQDGRETTYDPRRQQGVSIYREQERAFSAGDRVQLTARLIGASPSTLYPSRSTPSRITASVVAQAPVRPDDFRSPFQAREAESQSLALGLAA